MSEDEEQLLFDFMPAKNEAELQKAQLAYKLEQMIQEQFSDYHKKHLEDNTWFRKKWLTDDIKRRFLY